MANEKVQVRERAGLEEARLNEELIDFLRSKTFTYILVAIAAIALGYSGLRKYKEIENQKAAAAFADFEQAIASENPSPDALERIAEAYDQIGTVGQRARLAAADAHLRLVRSGIKPGAVTTADGTVAKEDLLSEDDRKQNLERAGQLYQQVLTASQGVQGRFVQTIEAMYGLAAVAESKRDIEGAKKLYEQIVSMTENGTYALQAGVAKDRIAALSNLGDVKLLSVTDMPWLAPKPATTVSPNATPDQTAPAPAPKAGPDAPAAGTEAKPADPAPGAAAPAPAEQPKPADAKPADAKPADAKPAEPKPAEPATNPK